MRMLHFFCHGFTVFVAAASIFAQSNETTPPSGKDFKSILIEPAKETKPWSINFAPYGWVTAVDGTISLRGITSHVHESAIDTLKSLQGAFMAVAEIRYERWVSSAISSMQRLQAARAHRVAFCFQARPQTWKNLSIGIYLAGAFGFRVPSFQVVCPHRGLSWSWIQLLAERDQPQSYFAWSLRRH